MGIPLYFKYLKENHKNVVKETNFKDVTCDTLYFDFNCIIHNCAHKLRDKSTEDQVIKSSCQYLKNIIDKVLPVEVFVSVDGVPPFSKMMQQRSRRFLSQWSRDQDPCSDNEWDSNCVTPGTLFMDKLNRALHELSGQGIYVSDSNEPGEGEQKIFKDIKKHAGTGQKSMVYGLDADLMMLSLLCPQSDITILRPDTLADTYYLVDVNRLRSVVYGFFYQKARHLSEEQAMKEYVCICSLMGNDFIPGIASLPVEKRSLDLVLDSYMKAVAAKGRVLVNGTTVDISLFIEMVHLLANLEDDGMARADRKYYGRQVYTATRFPNIIQPSKINWRDRYYQYLFNNPGTIKVTDVCKNYLSGVQWSMEYHMTRDVDQWWSYRYHYAPTLHDLAKTETSASVDRGVVAYSNSNVQIDKHMQMMAVLPASYLCKTPYRNVVHRFPHLFPSNFAILSYLKIHMSECTPLIPKMSQESLSQMRSSGSAVSVASLGHGFT